eukprot:gb/GEZN01025029.1/.p1 GENE.gb/GEZN01025029.1/~~gb/GEZN01025029.1/.p1  ORF type:complete len:135 (+),score=12.63 gb/GEZN01025029.1/:137-541(+)
MRRGTSTCKIYALRLSEIISCSSASETSNETDVVWYISSWTTVALFLLNSASTAIFSFVISSSSFLVKAAEAVEEPPPTLLLSSASSSSLSRSASSSSFDHPFTPSCCFYYPSPLISRSLFFSSLSLSRQPCIH